MHSSVILRLAVIVSIIGGALLITYQAEAYPPAVGILAKNRSCASCHVNNGPWRDDAQTIIDILDSPTKKSLRSEDGAFRIEVQRGETRTVLTVIGRDKAETNPPLRNAWLYVDTSQIQKAVLSKFSPGWDVNLPMACRLVGDKSDAYEGAFVTVLPMTVRPTDAARDAELELQVMLTSGVSIKGSATEGIISNCFIRNVSLTVVDR